MRVCKSVCVHVRHECVYIINDLCICVACLHVSAGEWLTQLCPYLINHLAWRKRVIDGNRVMAMKRPAGVALMAASPKVKAAATPLVCAMCATTTDDHDAVHTHDRARWADYFKVSKPRDGEELFSRPKGSMCYVCLRAKMICEQGMPI